MRACNCLPGCPVRVHLSGTVMMIGQCCLRKGAGIKRIIIAPPRSDSPTSTRTRIKLSPLQLRELLSSSPEDLKDRDLNLDQDSPYSKSADKSPATAEHGHPDEVERVLVCFFTT